MVFRKHPDHKGEEHAQVTSEPPAIDEETDELRPRSAGALPSDEPLQAAFIPPDKRVGDNQPGYGKIDHRFECRGAGGGYPVSYIAAPDRLTAVKFYRRQYGLDYIPHINVFVTPLED